MYLNVINTHRLCLVKIYEKINKGEPGVGRSKGALLFQENMNTLHKTLTVNL